MKDIDQKTKLSLYCTIYLNKLNVEGVPLTNFTLNYIYNKAYTTKFSSLYLFIQVE